DIRSLKQCCRIILKSMFKAERLQKIKKIIFERKQVDVSTLSSLLNVSDVTIRNDLEQLEKTGFIIRMHGGAVLNESTTQQDHDNDALSLKNIVYNKDKEEIGKIAASLIKEKEWVFLGPGSTCYFIAKELMQRKNINVMTNNFYVVNALFENPAINLVVAGGTANHERCCTFGDIFAKSIESIFFSKAFFTVGGVDLNAGYTSVDSNEAELIKTIAQKTKELILAVDHTKFDNIAFMQAGDLGMANTVISNNKMPEAYKQYYSENGIRAFTSYDLNQISL
ncbi:MAG: DeoR/GlpR family DNA-binding transcription regulator, partial [Christensenella sp.]|uniref:DeoR/GlpR family DNA-binding transcription regulator n=1 Tax=Christensenella sp. TaxID=1935934 RepID=UPI002B2070B3